MTAAQSGARWGYRLITVQIVLIPVLYLVVELAARLGLVTGKGHAQLIRERFGRGWALLVVAALLLSATGAMVTELAGMVGAGSLAGLPPMVVLAIAVPVLTVVVLSGGHRRVELIGVGFGLFELAFFVAAAHAHPEPARIAASLWAHQPLGDAGYRTLITANVGAVIMPWMIFYEQAAVVDKGLDRRRLGPVRLDIAIGAVLTQAVMIAVVVAAAARPRGSHGALQTVAQISAALTPALGVTGGRLAFALGIAGAALVAAIVVALASAWALGELLGVPRSLAQGVGRAPVFYGTYFVMLAAAAALVLVSPSLIRISIEAEVVNAAVLPIVLGFLLLLAWRELPTGARPRRIGWSVVFAVGVGVALMGLLGSWSGLGR
ncbi:MAG TPA: divalent metal cation transporter [Candidatus Dormibacteraeota bacterium]|nr:divalent metal cation transporter [Candidatus Dormibacteraeota bacterium]